MSREERTIPDFFTSGRSWITFHGAACLLVLSILALSFGSAHQYIQSNLVNPMLFQTRELLGMTPQHTEKLKIIVLDDSSFSYLGGPRLSAPQLSMLLQHLNQSKPKAILIDSLLSETLDDPDNDLETLRDSDIPVYSGAYLSQHPITYRYPLEGNQEVFSCKATSIQN